MNLFSKTLLLFVSFVLVATSLLSQKVLILEKRGTLKSRRYYQGDEITFRKMGDKTWHTSELVRMIPEDGIIVLDGDYVRINEIRAIKRKRNRQRRNSIGNQLYFFGTAWGVYTGIDELVAKRPTDWEAAAYVSGSSFVLGTLLKTLFKSKTYKIGNRRWLRMTDLTPIPTQT